MSGEERSRPRAFRLDDGKVLVSDADAAAATEFRRSGGVVVRQGASTATAPSPRAAAPAMSFWTRAISARPSRNRRTLSQLPALTTVVAASP